MKATSKSVSHLPHWPLRQTSLPSCARVNSSAAAPGTLAPRVAVQVVSKRKIGFQGQFSGNHLLYCGIIMCISINIYIYIHTYTHTYMDIDLSREYTVASSQTRTPWRWRSSCSQHLEISGDVTKLELKIAMEASDFLLTCLKHLDVDNDLLGKRMSCVCIF